MAHLLHKDVLKRITDTALYGNEYSLNEYLSDLTSGIFEADLNGEVNTYRQNLQNDYVKKLIMISGASKPSPYDYLSQAAAQYQLKAIDKMIKYNKGEGATRVHREYLHSQIDKAFSGS